MIRPITSASPKVFAGIALLGIVGLVGHGSAVAQQVASQITAHPSRSLSLDAAPGHEEATQSSIIEPAGAAAPSDLNVGTEGNTIHIFPTYNNAALRTAAGSDNGPLLYHTGGLIMGPTVTIYPIFWVPAKLQTGAATGMSTHYQAVEYYSLADYMGHGLGAISTQYFQTTGTTTKTTTYVQNKGGIGANYYTDSSPYPASACNDAATPGNCLSDAQIRAEIQKVITFAKLTGGLDKIFMLFTSSGEGSCFDSSSKACAYTQYCAYHSHYYSGSGQPVVIYANEPFGDTSNCQVPGAPSPNGDPNADAAATSASHELSEAVTDPLGNAWFTARGNENGDLCAYTYGSATYDSGMANQQWNGHNWLLQEEFSNHTNRCLLVGP